MIVDELEKLGVAAKSITRILNGGLLPRAKEQLVIYGRLVADGADVGPGLLVDAVLNGHDLKPPPPAQEHPAYLNPEPLKPAIETHELGCPECGLTWAVPVGTLERCEKCQGELVPVAPYERLRAQRRRARTPAQT